MGDRVGNFEAHLDMLLEDCSNIIQLLANYNYFEDSKTLELVTTLPSAVDIDVSIATVQRWKELQKRYNKPLRIYAYSYNPEVEKLFLRLIQESENIFLTPIPGEWKGRITYA